MTTENKQNETYKRQRYKSREMKLEITPDLVDSVPEVIEEKMEDAKDGRSKEEEFAQLLLKSVEDLSTTEAEYMAVTHARKESVWLQSLCSNMGLVQRAIRTDCDSQSAISWQRTVYASQRQSILMFSITL